MKTGFLKLASVLLLAGALLPDEARAANELVESALACTQINRISHSDATCITASWDNTPPASSGAAGGSTYKAESHCHKYGTIKVHIDIDGDWDLHFVLDSAGEESGKNYLTDVRQMSCCFSASDLCWREQVEANDQGKISHITVSGSSVSTSFRAVSTHWERYRFCQEYPNYIYCTVDPQGDANTDPGPACAEDSSCNCGDHHCTADDCESEWNGNTPVSRGLFKDDGNSDGHGCAASDDTDYGSRFSATIDAEDGTSQSCTLQVVCGSGVTYTGMNATVLDVLEVTADVGDIDDLYNCSGRVKKTSCGTGTLVSTRVEEIYHTLPEGDGDGDGDDDDDDDNDDS